MHTLTANRGTTFNYNSDFSGAVIISRGDKTIEIPAEDLLEFVAYAYILRKRINELEGMEWRELLGGAPADREGK